MNRSLKLASDLSLPLETVTQTIALLAKRRAGKSYTMRRLVEQLFKANQQVVLVDPKGDQWGVRSAADGKGPGLPIVILGGERGDVPLEPSGGEVVAKLVVEERVSILIDVSPFRKYEVATFMTAFLENLYRLKAREIYRTPMMLVIDEADAIAPQKPQKGEERMLGAAEDIVRRGGQRGIGCVLVTQRSAVLNKNVLTQAQMLVALRTIAPQDLAAMDAWIQVHGEPEQRKTLMESLPSLPVGDAWFWSPGWPTGDGIFKRVHVLPIETFDSGATPKPGERPVEPKHVADVDLDGLKRQMAATIEKAKADDPRELRKQIAGLQRELTTAKKRTPSVEMERVEVSIVSPATVQALDRAILRIEECHGALVESFQQVFGPLAEIRQQLQRVARTPIHAPTPRQRPDREVARPRRSYGSSSDEALGGGERKILTALAQYPDGRTKTQVAILTGYAVLGGGFNNYLSALRAKSYVRGSGERLEITDAGLSALGEFEPLPKGPDLLRYWLGQLGKAERSILEVLASRYPRALSKNELGAAAGYEASGGGFNNALSRLRTLELIEGRGDLKASDDLF